MKKYRWFFIECLLLLFPAVSNAINTPHWICDDRAYEYDMSMYINLYQRGVLLEKWDKLEVAAFCENECRGVAIVEEINDQKGNYYYIRVRSNVTSGETITFKCYNHEKDEETLIPGSVVFTASGISGYPSLPFKLTIPFIEVTGVSLNKTTTTLYTGATEILLATIAPLNATDKTVSWSSDNPSVATVENGVIKGAKSGQANITVTTADGNHTTSCLVTILQHVTGISLNKNELSFYIGDSETLLATVFPLDATNKKNIWSSDAPSIVAVDANGLVTGIQPGQASISVTTEDGNFQATCLVTVSKAVTGVSLNKESLDLKVDETAILIATVVPEDATNKSIIWSSGDETIATVDQNGLVHALKVGETSITVIAQEGQFKASCKIVIAPGVGIGASEWSAIKVYPTVTDSHIYIYGLSGDERISIIDSRGCLVRYFDVENENQRIELSGLSKGLYLLLIDENTHLAEWKIIKR